MDPELCKNKSLPRASKSPGVSDYGWFHDLSIKRKIVMNLLLLDNSVLLLCKSKTDFKTDLEIAQILSWLFSGVW